MPRGAQEKPPPDHRVGHRLGPWTLSHLLGRGHNGEVWMARDSAFRFVALKVQRHHPKMTEQHFAQLEREIEFMRERSHLPGIMPVQDDGGGTDGEPRWFTMPVATPLLNIEWVDDPGAAEPAGSADAPREAAGPLQLTEAFLAFASTMGEVHGAGLAHTDIKARHLFRLGDAWVIGDWGFVQSAERRPLHGFGGLYRAYDRKFFAPEQRQRHVQSVDPALADVYCLAASIRHLAERLTVDHRVRDLLDRCTAVAPQKRPTMAMVRNTLADIVDGTRQV